MKSSPTAKPRARSARRRESKEPAKPIRQTTLWLALALAVVTIAVYSPVHGHPFANLDDGPYVYSNPHVQAGLSWQTVKWAFASFGSVTPDVPDWHPLAWLSHALDSEIFGPGPAGPHDVNLLLHALNAVLLFLVLQRATGFAGRSAMVAGLFALHPMNVESVAWIAERKNLLSMTFFLLALMAYGWYARKPSAGRYGAVAGMFALGLMAKPQVVTLPFVLLLWDYWPLQRIALRSSQDAVRHSLFAFRQKNSPGISGEQRIAKGERRTPGEQRIAKGERRLSGEWRFLVLEKLPLFALAAASCVVTVKSQIVAGGINQQIALPARLGNAAVSYVRYLAKAFWPADLSPFYPHPGSSLPAWEVIAAALVLLGISTVVVVLRQRRYLPVGWFWFLGTLVPMIGLVQLNRQAMADRYAYISFIGLFLLVSWGVAELAEQRQLSQAVLRTAGVAVLAVLAAITYRQVGYWGDNLTLWTHALEVTQGNFLAENIVGSTLMDQGRADEALPHFLAAAQMNPSDPSAYMAIGTYDLQHGEVRQAIEQYEKTIALTDHAVQKNLWLRETTFARMGSAYRQLGEFEQARTNFQKALEIDPQDGQAWLALGIVMAQGGDARGAVEAYAQAMKIQPSDVGYLLLARALEQTGQSSQAEAARAEALRLSRNLPAAQKTVEAIFAPKSGGAESIR